jgi:hypothetical protein
MGKWVRMTVAAMVLEFLGGVSACGPLFYSMGHRVAPEEQEQIDAGWNNLLTPTGRADRQLLLDVLLSTEWYEKGVDHLQFRSEKKLAAGGTVVMEVSCDRGNPDGDRLVIEVYDKSAQLVRRERYTLDEVDAARVEVFNVEYLRQEMKSKPLSPEEQAQLETWEKRWAAIVATTQPAGR